MLFSLKLVSNVTIEHVSLLHFLLNSVAKAMPNKTDMNNNPLSDFSIDIILI